jgi:Tfp pilus assembly protein PilV
MKKASSITRHKYHLQSGMSLVEALLAMAIFAILSVGVISAIIYGQESSAVAGTRERAVKIAEEGIEAVRNIRDSGYGNLPADGTYGLVISGGVFALSGPSDTTDIFARTITLATVDSRTRTVNVNVNWQQTAQRTGAISLNTYLTDWVTSPAVYRHGMLVYGDGGTTTDEIRYQTYDDSNGTWSAPALTADVDSATTNKYLRETHIYASSTRDEKTLITRHYDGTRQWFYSQVYNGTTGSWGNVNLLTNFLSSTNLHSQKCVGAYLANGDFVVLYSDNTNIPKFKVWNGTSWSTASGSNGASTQSIGGIPGFITLKQRPNTNELMAVFFDQSSDTNSQYFYIGANGTYETADWSLSTEHSATAPSTSEKYVDFNWASNNSLKGAMIFVNSNADKAMNIKIWTSNGSGGGSWSTSSDYSTSQTNNIGALGIESVVGTSDFVVCNKDTSTPALITCIRANISGWIASSNITFATTSDTGAQLSFGIGFEQNTPTYGVNIFSNNTGVLQYKLYNISTSTWQATPTAINSPAVGVIKTTMAIPNAINGDIMLLTSDANRDIFSVLWDGSTHNIFSTPAGKAWSVHGTNGSATTDFWYDFTWDGM